MTNAAIMERCLADTPAELARERDALSVLNIERYLATRE